MNTCFEGGVFMKNDESKMRKIPVLNDDELKELGSIMYSDLKDELAKKRFWKKVYEKRGIKY